MQYCLQNSRGKGAKEEAFFVMKIQTGLKIRQQSLINSVPPMALLNHYGENFAEVILKNTKDIIK